MIFYLITHKLHPGLPEPGSTCNHAESLSNKQVSLWQAAKRSLCDTHRRPGNLKNENQITASTSLLPFHTARGAGSLVTQHLQNPAVSLVLIISQRCEASLGTCSSRKTKWQLCNFSLWHIMETQKPEVTQLSPFQLQAEASWVSRIFTFICNWLVAIFVPVHISDHTTLFLGNKVQNSFHSKVMVFQSQPNNAGSSPPPSKYHLWASWQKDTEIFYFPLPRDGI